jgi:hypothetical protein
VATTVVIHGFHHVHYAARKVMIARLFTIAKSIRSFMLRVDADDARVRIADPITVISWSLPTPTLVQHPCTEIQEHARTAAVEDIQADGAQSFLKCLYYAIPS